MCPGTQLEQSDLISIVVPAYNEEKSIAKAIDSILAQTYKNIEIVIVYLDSKDKTLDIINSYSDSRIKLVHQQDKLGIGSARNIGIQNSTGKYIGFVECDEIPSDYYEKLYSRLKEDNSQIAMGEIFLSNELENKMFSKVDKNETLETFYSMYSAIKNGACFDKLIDLSMIKEHNILFPQIYRWEDNPWILEVIYYAKKMSLVKGAVYNYHPLSEYSEEYLEKLRNDIVPIAKLMMDFAKEKNFPTKDLILVKEQIINCIASPFLDTKTIYEDLLLLMDGFPKLRKIYNKKRIKKFKRDIINKLMRKK